jgi:hypothetical protein
MDAMFAAFFSFSFQEIALSFLWSSFGNVVMETVIKHPQAPQKMMIVALAEIIVFRGAQWRGCGNRTATAGRERNVVYGVESSTASVKRRGKNISQPVAFLDLGQSANGANPDGCAKEQPLKK